MTSYIRLTYLLRHTHNLQGHVNPDVASCTGNVLNRNKSKETFIPVTFSLHPNQAKFVHPFFLRHSYQQTHDTRLIQTGTQN